MRVDPEQRVNLYNDPKYSQIIKDLDTKLTQFFNKYADPKYDLWKGGSAKAYLAREGIWKSMYGPKWHVIMENGATVPKFTEAEFRDNNVVNISHTISSTSSSLSAIKSMNIPIYPVTEVEIAELSKFAENS